MSDISASSDGPPRRPSTLRRLWGRRCLPAVLALAGLAVFAAPAFATFHLEMVNEVMLASSSGSTGVQFVELLDNGGSEEQFTPVFAPYKLAVYDAAGNQLGSHTLDPTGLRNAAAMDTPYLISTTAADAAFGVTGNERLDLVLPTTAGQVCFQANPSPPAFSCMTYGTITKQVPTNSNGTGSVHGPVPPNGQSDQRQPNGTVQAAPPTPKAANRAGTGTSPGGGPGSPSGSTFAGANFTARRATLRHKGRVGVALGCPQGTTGSCAGTLTLRSHRGRHPRIGHAKFALAPGGRTILKIKLSRRALRQLRRRGKLVVDATIAAHDGSGQSKTTSATLTLVAA